MSAAKDTAADSGQDVFEISSKDLHYIRQTAWRYVSTWRNSFAATVNVLKKFYKWYE